MQFLKVPYELIEDTNITANEYRVYTYLMSRYNDDKKCSYPSIDVIAEKIGLSTRTVMRSIKNLVKLEYLKVTKKKGLYGIYNEYSDIKYLVPKKEVPSKKELDQVPSNIIVSDCKESGVQLPIPSVEEEVPELSEYTRVHQQKISLIEKLGIKLTNKQKDIIGDLDLEVLRESIRTFKKKNGKYFSFLINLYIDNAERDNIEISEDIERYLKGSYIKLTEEEKETQKALIELELYGVPVF